MWENLKCTQKQCTPKTVHPPNFVHNTHLFGGCFRRDNIVELMFLLSAVMVCFVILGSAELRPIGVFCDECTGIVGGFCRDQCQRIAVDDVVKDDGIRLCNGFGFFFAVTV